jgi:hypothetical protein
MSAARANHIEGYDDPSFLETSESYNHGRCRECDYFVCHCPEMQEDDPRYADADEVDAFLASFGAEEVEDYPMSESEMIEAASHFGTANPSGFVSTSRYRRTFSDLR